MAVDETDPATQVQWLVRGHWVVLAIRAAVDLGVFDALEQPLSAGDLAIACSADPSATARLLTVLVDLGLVAVEDDAFCLTDQGRTLCATHPSRLRSLVRLQTEPENLLTWRALADAVRVGGGVFEQVNGMTSWELLAADRERQRDFDAAMARRAPAQVRSIRTACDLTAVSTVVDVGGGMGGMLAALLEAEPHLRGIVADRPEVAAAADATFASAGLGGRGRGEAADFFVAVPAGGDVYTIANVLHDWDDSECVSILRTVRAAMRPDARVWVVEVVLDAPGRSLFDARDLHLVDLHMLVMFGARERTAEEYGDLLEAAGFDRGRLLTSGQPWDVIEARVPKG